ncbi:hypothetical protein [Streptomyces sp. HD]|uniref:hypothetical protein n=1 Tax=Streptomyces sp. HD TaxID=3020892 RepID=UPI00232D29D6|nr:hypothetical protein [Streptomyces sp. HD]MDC0773374.1 hypothetical protein [Streptomyces sp. HD]
MRPPGETTLVVDQHTSTWEFGDFPYGLEPLTMPPVGHATASFSELPHPVPDCDLDVVRFQLSALADSALAGAPEGDEPSKEQLFWFRWITGHQITFLIWHLTGRLLAKATGRELPDEHDLTRLERYTYGYCAMLLYTGSCPRDLYHSLIRPRMYLQHRGFSGTWAPDFVPVRGLFRGRGPAGSSLPEAAGLARAVELNKTIHDGIAARLVPEGRSLLQQAMGATTVRVSQRTALLYDNFFMTLRAEVSEEDILAQLFHRLRAVALDVSRHGLYPLGHEGDDRPEELRSPEVADCEAMFSHVLRGVADAAIGETKPHAHL